MTAGRAAGRLGPLGALLGGLGAAAAGALVPACGADCCTVDSLPIPLTSAPGGLDPAAPGALLALARSSSLAGGQPFPMVVDTGWPITVLSGAGGGRDLQHGTIELLDAALAAPSAVRAQFRGIGLLDLPLGPVGAAGTQPGGVLGGDLLRAFSIDLRFGAAPSITFWRHIGASSGFLGDAGYAVLRFALHGGGEVNVRGDADFLGLRGPLQLAPTRVVMRTCAAPRAFSPSEPRELCCSRDVEFQEAPAGTKTGVDLSLLLATGVGPMVLSPAAWARIEPRLPAPPTATPGELLVATWPTPIPVTWTSIPRVAFVDLEAGPNADPGPCVELARARRIEWVSTQQVMGPETTACYQVCDTDPREPDKALNSAAYVELGGAIPVAVLRDDSEQFLQSLRFDVRPEGPEIDGVVGAGVLAGARLELDYLSTPRRAVFSCDPGVPRETCWAAARCPRLPDREQRHLCFGLGAHGLPAMCAPSGC